MRHVAYVVGILVVALFACGGSGSSSSGTPTGGSCGNASACQGGTCAVSPDFPAGYCTKGCSLNDPTSCPGGSVCIDDASGAPADSGITAICYQTCQSSADCGRAGYACLEKASHMVCRQG